MMNSPQGRAAASSFLSHGFRSFFVAAALWALVSMALWLVTLTGELELPSAFDPVSWHAHEALFGYLGAVLAGFLLTAVPNWTSRPALTGRPLAGLLALWILGRIAVAVSEWLTPLAVALIDLSCPVVLVGYVLREVLAGRNWRNLVVIAMIGVFIAGNALFHRDAAGDAYAAAGYGLRTGLAAGIMMISLIGGRIVPAFTRNWLSARGSEVLPAPAGRLDGLALALTLVVLAMWVMLPDAPETGYLLLASGLAQAVRLLRWRGLHTGREPLLWILHVGYAFVPLGMLGVGATILWPDALPPASAQHLWMAGAIGVMTLAVMTRATLGHSGGELTADPGTVAVHLLIVVSVLVRFAGGLLPEHAMILWTLAGLLWCSSFAGFVLLHWKRLMGAARE